MSVNAWQTPGRTELAVFVFGEGLTQVLPRLTFRVPGAVFPALCSSVWIGSTQLRCQAPPGEAYG